jgi:hypothetical protein
VRPCSQAIVALTFSFYVLRPMFPDCDPPALAVRYLACICIGKSTTFFSFVNYFYSYLKQYSIIYSFCSVEHLLENHKQLPYKNLFTFSYKLVESIDRVCCPFTIDIICSIVLEYFFLNSFIYIKYS